MKDKGEESSERQKGGERGRGQERVMELSGVGGKKSGREDENIPKIFVRKIHEGFCSITMQTPLLLLKSLNEHEREPKSL